MRFPHAIIVQDQEETIVIHFLTVVMRTLMGQVARMCKYASLLFTDWHV